MKLSKVINNTMEKTVNKDLAFMDKQEIEKMVNKKIADRKLENEEIKDRLNHLFLSDETYIMEHAIDILYVIALKHRKQNDEIIKSFSQYFNEGC